jgi:hypothetical protein
VNSSLQQPLAGVAAGRPAGSSVDAGGSPATGPPHLLQQRAALEHCGDAEPGVGLRGTALPAVDEESAAAAVQLLCLLRALLSSQSSARRACLRSWQARGRRKGAAIACSEPALFFQGGPACVWALEVCYCATYRYHRSLHCQHEALKAVQLGARQR